MNKSFLSKFTAGAAGLAFLLVCIGAVYLTVSNLRLRLDLTADRLYTLSQGSKTLLASLEGTVTLKFYFNASSATVPQALKLYARQVEDLLKEYELAGRGHIVLESYDPRPDSDYEEWAQRYGLEPQQFDPLSPPFYFGLAVLGPNGEEQVIRGFSPQQEASLEYDITRLIARAADPSKPVIGLMTSFLDALGTPMNPMMMMNRQQPPNQGWAVFQQLKQDYTILPVAADATEIPAEVKALIVLHPKEVSDAGLYAIDQFVLRGGRLIACVDSFSLKDLLAQRGNQMQGMMQPPSPSTLGKLFDAWGISFDPSKAVADLRASTRLGGGEGGRSEENPAFLSLDAKNVNKKDLLTASLSMLMIPFAGSFTYKGDQTFVPLLTTSADGSCLVDPVNLQFGSGALRSQLNPDKTARVIAARLQGTLKSAFATNAPGHRASGKANIVLFADADFIADDFSVTKQNFFGSPIIQPINDNLALFANAVEQFAGREELIGVRARGRFNRPFAKVDELEYRAMLKWKQEEERLEAALTETQNRLRELQEQKQGNQKLILSKEQQEQIGRFRQEQLKTRNQLKTVRKRLNSEIENLGLALKAINIGAVALLVAVFGTAYGFKRRRRH